jgi:hypothetical protein
MQKHAPVRGQQTPGRLKKLVVSLAPKMLECADADNPVDRLVEFFPPGKAEFDVCGPGR